jgi:hypothetical protein
MKEREVLKIADEYLRPINQNLESIGSATNFSTYVNETYIPVVLPLMATSTRDRYRGIINNYLLPHFGELCLRDLSRCSSKGISAQWRERIYRTNRGTRSRTCCPSSWVLRCAIPESRRRAVEKLPVPAMVQ